MRQRPGSPYPLGATWDGVGVNFALFSEHATGVELCLFDSPDAATESQRVRMCEHTDMVWHCYLLDVRPGQLYGYRVEGPYEPNSGDRFNRNKVLLDPYAKAIGRTLRWGDEMFGYRIGDDAQDLSFDDRDNAALAPLAAVVDPAFTWGDDERLRTPWHETVIYEAHVRGFTKLHPEVQDNFRGTYAALATDPVLTHFRKLGVTAVELMPVHHFIDDRHLLDRGLRNYWGYNTLGFFAPHPLYAASEGGPLEAVREFKMMVRALHAAGIEVILDVVYNHTGEGSHLGPTLSLRGIDNRSYYRAVPNEPRYYMDFTGCGNSLNMVNPRVLQLIMDSLRYWAAEMHVDGFRFDLASTLARKLHEVDKLGAFFEIIHQDPLLSQLKLIAEPWDLGEGGYQVGNFPLLWTEWNGKYRDSVRRFWRGDGGEVSEFATRLVGSSDLYEQSGRRPHASINFITAHDGFTLNDLVSYNDKHNDANGENNGDGENNNSSWNCGVEGPTDDPRITALRQQQKRNFIATLLLSQGVPMLCGGDEVCRTQAGNNNAYCQDNEISWTYWDLNERQRAFLDFTAKVIHFRRAHPVFRRRNFMQGRSIRGGVKDLSWFDPKGREMTDEAWNAGFVRSLMVRLAGHAMDEVDAAGNPVRDDTFVLLLNAHEGPLAFTLPAHDQYQRWTRVLDTADPALTRFSNSRPDRYRVSGRSLAVFRLDSVPERPQRPRRRGGGADQRDQPHQPAPPAS